MNSSDSLPYLTYADAAGVRTLTELGKRSWDYRQVVGQDFEPDFVLLGPHLPRVECVAGPSLLHKYSRLREAPPMVPLVSFAGNVASNPMQATLTGIGAAERQEARILVGKKR